MGNNRTLRDAKGRYAGSIGGGSAGGRGGTSRSSSGGGGKISKREALALVARSLKRSGASEPIKLSQVNTRELARELRGEDYARKRQAVLNLVSAYRRNHVTEIAIAPASSPRAALAMPKRAPLTAEIKEARTKKNTAKIEALSNLASGVGPEAAYHISKLFKVENLSAVAIKNLATAYQDFSAKSTNQTKPIEKVVRSFAQTKGFKQAAPTPRPPDSGVKAKAPRLLQSLNYSPPKSLGC